MDDTWTAKGDARRLDWAIVEMLREDEPVFDRLARRANAGPGTHAVIAQRLQCGPDVQWDEAVSIVPLAEEAAATALPPAGRRAAYPTYRITAKKAVSY